ncbi:coiled-coil domain-containing protein 80 isoform X1 [Lates japonicus]|uniref:Coiled-coil domain-containing protein 80 isoform X1 n=1 Tax=Lates japonicus TaxID=270547 RepID=A0AAD3NFL5_LATJO|nr:coiled-coil domain-containing protein 80 isoform X1 [Lates japonicus]
MKAVFDYIDTFSSRIREVEQQRERWGCSVGGSRLFIISAPNDEEWAIGSSSMPPDSQACNLGLRHIAI